LRLASNSGHQRTKQTFTAGNYVDYTYDDIGQLKTAKGKESGGAVRPHEQFGYAVQVSVLTIDSAKRAG
jgi:hypothetical protein